VLESDTLELEKAACTPERINPNGFNPRAILPYGCTTDHIRHAMQDFLDFLQLINTQLNSRGLQRLETMLMPANFSSVVGEFCISAIPKYCPTLVKNQYHNGHPDLIPAGRYPHDAVQYAREGIEVKASRYMRGWQGHNAEAIWLMVFTFSASRGTDKRRGVAPLPFRFEGVQGAQLELEDWTFSGRSETSRRTITASINTAGYAKMVANWIYRR
jgi:hypothetical protein